MASQLFRNLDRLAGVAGATITGERARRDMLTERDLGRSQQSYLQGQRLDTQRQLQRDRQRGIEDRFKRSQTQAKEFHEDAMGMSRKRLDAENMPEHEYVKELCEKLLEFLPDYMYEDEEEISRIVLLKNKNSKYKNIIESVEG